MVNSQISNFFQIYKIIVCHEKQKWWENLVRGENGITRFDSDRKISLCNPCWTGKLKMTPRGELGVGLCQYQSIPPLP